MHLYRRRWTLIFSLPFTVLMAGSCAYSLFVLCVADDRLINVIAGVAAFGTFCVAGTFAKAVLEALNNRKPAVSIDATGVTDTRGGGLLLWHDIESVKLDPDEQLIRVKFVATTATQRRGLISKTRRLFNGADHTIALGGLSYNHRKLAQALAQFQRQSRAGGEADSAQ
jgi:hypothetical protein